MSTNGYLCPHRRYITVYINTYMSEDTLPLESHPWQPFIPDNAKVLIMGTFPPKAGRWSMNFYYPNYINDFWRIMGLLFYSDAMHFVIPERKTFNLPAIEELLNEKGIAMNDTGCQVRRLKDNASDKYLEIVRPVDLAALLDRMPLCRSVATTGEKAAGVIASLTATEIPRLGEMVTATDGLEIWRMPSTSRAYPLKLEKKAEFYGRMFRHIGIL